MASFHSSKTLLFLALALIFYVQCTIGGITCESLEPSKCAFAVSSSGTRCVLEKQEGFFCRASEIEAESLTNWVETDECLDACGLSRDTVGISSDSLLDPHFTQNLCSLRCYQGCPNIVDLYFNLAAGEGVFLPELCGVQERSARRGMAEIRSSDAAAAGPQSGSVEKLACAPTRSVQALDSTPALPPL